MKRINMAVDKFHDEYACSQAILSEYGALYGLPHDTALKLASGFAGGMRMGKTCGAVTGAYMVLGLAFGNHNCGKMDGRKPVYEAVSEFTKNFIQTHGTVKCSDLLGYDISTPGGIQAVHEQNLFQTICPKFVKTAAELLERLIAKR